jgi:3-oxoacyl-[acyl-carrier-protein] synthase II
MTNAIRNAQIDTSNIDYINAHGTSTLAGDAVECHAIKKVFGESARSVKISSTKSMIGHLLGAAGGVEAIFCLLAIRDGVAPPTINLDNPDVGCDLDFVPHVSREMNINVALSNSFGFGGTNGSLVIAKI